MELRKKIEALKLFIGTSPVIPVLRELYNKIVSVEAKIPKPVDLAPLRSDIQRLNTQATDQFKTLEQELNKAIASLESTGTELDSLSKSQLEGFKQAAKNLEELRTDLLSRAHGGGNANRNIVVEGRTVLTPYTDINFVGTTSSITALTDQVAHQTKIIIPTGGGGGGTPAAPDTSIQFNDGGSFGGDADFTWNKTTNTLNLAADSFIQSSGQLYVQSGGDAQYLNFIAADAITDGFGGGGFSMEAGAGVGSGPGGEVDLIAGVGGLTGDGGNITLIPGMANGGFGGGLDGVVRIQKPTDASKFARLDTADLTLTRTFTFPDVSGVFELTTKTYTAQTGTYAILTTDQVINCTSGTFAVTLPTAVGVTGKVYNIKNSGTGVITVATTSSQTIDESTTQTLNQYDNLTVMSDGANWIIL